MRSFSEFIGKKSTREKQKCKRDEFKTLNEGRDSLKAEVKNSPSAVHE